MLFPGEERADKGSPHSRMCESDGGEHDMEDDPVGTLVEEEVDHALTDGESELMQRRACDLTALGMTVAGCASGFGGTVGPPTISDFEDFFKGFLHVVIRGKQDLHVIEGTAAINFPFEVIASDGSAETINS